MSRYLVIYGSDVGDLNTKDDEIWATGGGSSDGDGPWLGIYPCPPDASWEELGQLVASKLRDLIGDGPAINSHGWDESKYPDGAIYQKMVEIAIRDKKPFWWINDYVGDPSCFYIGQLLYMTRTHPKALWCVPDAVRELGWDGTPDN